MTQHTAPWLVLRHSLDDADASSSPDIILGGDKPQPGYSHNYDHNVSAAIAYDKDNNVYVRAMNASEDFAFGNVSVYLSTLDNLTSPSFWQRLLTEDKQTQQAIGAGPGEVGVTPAPFIWPDVEKAPWCVIAVISDGSHPVPDMPHWLNGQDGFDKWISSQTTMAYHFYKAPPKPVPSETYAWTGVIDLQNKDEQLVTFTITSTQFAKDAQVSFILDSKDVNSTVISMGNRTLSTGGVYSTSAKVSPGFQSKVTVTYLSLPDTGGHPLSFSLSATAEVPGPGGLNQTVELASFDVGIKSTSGS
ncbi:hypothetical protein [Pacificoceanicola onchidii]|uniref:hypothetical protein n=1 Tax=Pacificoceanicola onchidii TaxID=2562685 RepID=UPI0010A64D31|nr:hypothetical protein [Pacificoceanicola onchidii]